MNPSHCLMCLAGRGGIDFSSRYKEKSPEGLLVTGVIPPNNVWYPMPNGPNDQEDAIKGLPKARNYINKKIATISHKHHIPTKNFFLAGFSAGAVMAIEVTTRNDICGAAIHSGAILDIDGLPQRNGHDPKFYLFHNTDDMVFSWNDRFLPMADTLAVKDYSTKLVVRKNGGHTIDNRDIDLFVGFIQRQMDK